MLRELDHQTYEPYGYNANQPYGILYISCGGWSNETTLLGVLGNETSFKNNIDHTIQNGRIEPSLLVVLSYNNTIGSDSSDYELALQLTNNYHNELRNDLMPAVKSRWHTYATSTTLEAFRASRNHRGFAGFSMGSVNAWHTFQYCLDYFGWFIPISGSVPSDGSVIAWQIADQGFTSSDFSSTRCPARMASPIRGSRHRSRI